MKWKRYGKSMKSRLLIPVITVMLMQTIVLFLFILGGEVSQRLRSNAIAILNEKAENSRLQIERELVQHWMRDIQSSGAVVQVLEQTLAQSGKQAADIKQDDRLNRDILDALTGPLLDLLHRSYGNGVFVVLDGPVGEQGTAVKAGLYIRDMDASSYALDNSDLLLERGLPSISREYGIALDSYWELGFRLEHQDREAYFYNPYDAVGDQKISAKNVSNYGYLYGDMRLNPLDHPSVTYSMPLTLSDGTTIGVIGGELLQSNIRSMFGGRAGNSEEYLLMLGIRDPEQGSIRPIVVNSGLYQNYFGQDQLLFYTAAVEPNIVTVTDRNQAVWYAGVQRLNIYNNNTPFQSDQWVVVQLQKENGLFSFYSEIRGSLMISLLISLVMGAVAVLITGSISTSPIMKLSRVLRDTRRGEKITLTRTHINEIDELLEAIESLSADVAASASKISNILESSGIPIGVYEYADANEPVFCSRTLFEILGETVPKETYVYLEPQRFSQMIKNLQPEMELSGGQSPQDQLFKRKGVTNQWLRLKTETEENGHTIGVLSDVTADVIKQKLLERERNYDILTDLFNRRAFREAVGKMLTERSHETMAFVMWDLDNLKYVNDTYGHEDGDRYIRLFADYLRRLEATGAVVERHSGDEFAAVLCGGSKAELLDRIYQFADEMKQHTLAVPGNYQLPLRASAGVAWYPEHSTDFDTLLRYADFAMYMAKHNVKGVVREFDLKSYEENSYLLSGKEELNLLLEEKRVKFALQPIVDRNGSIYGYEALMRPQMKQLNNIQDLLKLARTQAKLSQIEELTWDGAMARFAELAEQRKLVPGSRFFINSIANTALSLTMIHNLEQQYPACLNRVVLEMTETEPLESQGMNRKVSTIERWQGMIALDDFGSGYNSEGVLLKLKPHIVKLDMELVRDVDQDFVQRQMVDNLIGFCHSQNILVLAEGVEREAELSALMEMGVDLFQGHYIARPELEVSSLDPAVVEKIKELSKK